MYCSIIIICRVDFRKALDNVTNIIIQDDSNASEEIDYNEETITALLDRDQHGITESESWANQYLSSFKVKPSC